MTIEIDQSGKIEDTARDTVIALSNDIQKTIRIPKRVKRQLQEIYRRQGKSRLFVLVVFSVGVYFVLRYLKGEHHVTIDVEYTGHEKAVLYFLSRMRSTSLITFGHVGKSSPADRLASKVSHDLERPTKTLTYEEILRVAQKMTETSEDEARAA